MHSRSFAAIAVFLIMTGLACHSSVASVASVANAASAPSPDAKIDGVKESVYTSRIVEIAKNWPPSGFPALDTSQAPFWIEGIRTPGNSDYIGLRKRVFIHASVQRVREVIEDFADYPSVYRGVQEVRVVSKAGDKIDTSWVRDRPLFFLGKIRYEQVYVVAESAGRVFYRYQLKSGNAVNYSDGVIVVEPAPGGTYVSSYDFFEGNFGLVKVVAENKIWDDALEGYARADLALKTKAENPEWSFKKIESYEDAVLKKFPVGVDNIHFLSSLSSKDPSK